MAYIPYLCPKCGSLSWSSSSICIICSERKIPVEMDHEEFMHMTEKQAEQYIEEHTPEGGYDPDAFRIVKEWAGRGPRPVIVSCPYCKSCNTQKISNTSRVASSSFFGFGSKKLGKQWHCHKCGSDF